MDDDCHYVISSADVIDHRRPTLGGVRQAAIDPCTKGDLGKAAINDAAAAAAPSMSR